MRFRATVQNVPTFFRQFIPFRSSECYWTRALGLIQTVEKLQKKCIIKFSETAMRIICNHEEGGVQVWSCVGCFLFSLSFLTKI